MCIRDSLYAALIIGEQGEDAVDCGGFAGAVRPQQAEYLAFPDIQTEVVQSQQIFVALHQIDVYKRQS